MPSDVKTNSCDFTDGQIRVMCAMVLGAVRKFKSTPEGRETLEKMHEARLARLAAQHSSETRAAILGGGR